MGISTIDFPGEIETWGPVHLFQGVEYVAYVLGASTGRTLPDPALAVYDATTFQNIVFADNSLALGADPVITFIAPYEGDFVMDVGDLTGGTGEYRADLVVYQGDISFGSDPGTFGPGTEAPFAPGVLDPDPFFGFI
jgi:hypothetical protein